MGSDRCKRTGLLTRCCHGASFGFGFVFTVLTVSTMFWITWFYFGFAIVEISQTQRRAIVDYSFTSTKPNPSPTSPPVRSTTLATEETSANSISKLPTATSVHHHRGHSRGESPIKVEKRKEVTVASSLAKGDFASRDRPPHTVPTIVSQDTPSLEVPPPRGPPRSKEEPLPVPILSGSSENSQEEDIHTRRVSTPGTENRPDDKSVPDTYSVRPDPRPDISPTKVYNLDSVSGSSKRSPDPDDRLSRDEVKMPSRDYIERDEVIPSRRDDVSTSRRTEPESAYRDPDFEREQPRRYASTADREISRYDDDDDDRGSRSRYDKRDRGRDTDDRYSKGDTRVYPDDRPASDDRYKERVRSSYPEESARRGDDDRYGDSHRDHVERPRYRDIDIDTRPKTSEDRPSARDDRYRDDDRYRSRIDESRPREEDRYRSRVDERYKTKDDEIYISSDDDKYRTRDDTRYRTRDDDRYRTRDEDRYRTRAEDRYRTGDEDRSHSRIGDRHASGDDDAYRRDTENRRVESPRYRDDKDDYRSKTDEDRKYIDTSPSRRRDEDFKEPLLRSSSVSLTADRKSSSSRSGYNAKNEEFVSDRDLETRDRSRSHGRDDGNPSKLSRPLYDEERYIDRDDDRRPSRFEDDEKRISPTRIRDEVSYSKSPLLDSRSKELVDDVSYIDRKRDRIKDDRYDTDDRIRGTRLQDSRGSVSMTSSSRRVVDDRDEYRTKLPYEKTENINNRRNITIDRRSEDDDEYKSRASRRDYDDDRYLRPSEERRRYRDDERYLRRDAVDDDDEYKRDRTRERYESDRPRTRDKYDDEARRYDDRKYDRPAYRDEAYYTSKDDRSLPLPVRKYDTYPEEDERIRRRDPVLSTTRKEDLDDRKERLRPSVSRDETRLSSRADYSEPKSTSRHRYEDDHPPLRNRDSKDNLPPSRSRDSREDLPPSRSWDSRKDLPPLRTRDTRDDLPPLRNIEPRDDLPPLRNRNSRDDYTDDHRYSETTRQPVRAKESIIGSPISTVYPRESSDVVIREKRFQVTENRPQNSRASASDEVTEDRRHLNVGSESRSRDVPIRPLSTKDVIEAAMKQSDNADQNPRKVHYPVFDPRVSNLTLPEIIRPSERRGTTITAKRRRSSETVIEKD